MCMLRFILVLLILINLPVIADNYNGMYTIAEHLVRDHGYRNFTYLAGPHGNTDARERRQAVYDVMKKY